MTNRIIYYYQTFTDLSPILVPNSPVTHIHLSATHFGTNPDGSPYIHINNNNPDDPVFNTMWQQIKKAHEMGIKIILMLGGAGGAYSDLFGNYDTYFSLLCDTIKKHTEISGVDLDIEEGVELNNVKKLINDIVKIFGEDFIIAMAPLPSSLQYNEPGMGGFIYKDLYKSDEGKYIDYFNGQFYGSYTFSDYDGIIKNGYPANKVVMGMISGQNFDMVLDTLKQVKHTYPDMGGTFIWEYYDAPKNWDKSVASVLALSESYLDYVKSSFSKVIKNIKKIFVFDKNVKTNDNIHNPDDSTIQMTHFNEVFSNELN
jgi:hypothetical protein